MIALIPARGGSKGLPGKNIKPLLNKPLIAYTIEAAMKAEGIDRVIVTTDSQEIAKVAQRYGAEVPFLRPDELSGDNASAVDVYLHAIEYLKDREQVDIEKFMILLPTAPLRDESDIDKAIELFHSQEADTLISMTEADTPVSWYYVRKTDGFVVNAGFDAERAVANRQLNDNYYIPNGAIYILDYSLLKEKRTYYNERTAVYLMAREKSIDIDTAFDFNLIEYLMKNKGAE